MQVYFLPRESGKRIFGVGFKTRSGSYDIRNPYGFKTMIGPKDLSIIKDVQPNANIHIFEGVFDFLSWLVLNKTEQPKEDVMVLNSTSLYLKAANYIRAGKYTSVTLWQDNDAGGEKLIKALLHELHTDKISISSMSHIYQGFNDLYQFLCSPNLSFVAKREALLVPPLAFKLSGFLDEQAIANIPG